MGSKRLYKISEIEKSQDTQYGFQERSTTWATADRPSRALEAALKGKDVTCVSRVHLGWSDDLKDPKTFVYEVNTGADVYAVLVVPAPF